MSTREAAIRDLLARATKTGRKVYGFSSQYPSCSEVKGGRVPPDFDWLCVSGDLEWTRLEPLT